MRLSGRDLSRGVEAIFTGISEIFCDLSGSPLKESEFLRKNSFTIHPQTGQRRTERLLKKKTHAVHLGINYPKKKKKKKSNLDLEKVKQHPTSRTKNMTRVIAPGTVAKMPGEPFI